MVRRRRYGESMRSGVVKFRQAIMDAGLNPPNHISPDHIHRFAGINKPRNNRAGWCWLSPDGNSGEHGVKITSVYLKMNG